MIQQEEGNLEIIYIIKNILKNDSPGLQMDSQFWSLVSWIARENQEQLERISTVSGMKFPPKFKLFRAIIQTPIYSV